MSLIKQFLVENNNWMEYCQQAWESVGKPEGLQPQLIVFEPVYLNKMIYKWWEQRYNGVLENVLKETAPGSKIINDQSELFRVGWKKYYEPITLWKQLRPLFTFAEALGGVTKKHLELAKAYILGQGIPSMAVDHALDSSPYEIQNWEEILFVCLSGRTLGLQIIRKNNFPSQVEDAFLKYTYYMYDKMWHEKQSRYNMPNFVSKSTLDEYIGGESRLLSSVFFGITIEWAFLLSDHIMSESWLHTSSLLRRIRQLNDELSDVDEDIVYGLFTFPYLHCLHYCDSGTNFAEIIINIWEGSRSYADEVYIKSLLNQARKILVHTGSFEETANLSLNQIKICTQNFMDYFPADKAFDLTLEINSRLSLISRLAISDWREKVETYQPNPFAPNKSTELQVRILEQ